MRKQELKDQLFKQLESHWASFLDEVSEMKAQVNRKLSELSAIYGPEIVRALLKQSKHDVEFQLNGGSQETSTVTKPTKVKKVASTKAVSKKKARRRKLKLSTAERKRRSRQVTYLNLLKKFSPRARVKYKHIFKKQGCQPAIDAMNSFLSK